MSIVIKTSVADFLFLFFLVVLSCCVGHCSCVIEAICQGDSIRDDTKETLISTGNFELGFFSPGNSTLRYVGVWYYSEFMESKKAVVWVANRDAPISDRNGVLRIGNDGNLVILDGNNTTVWNSNVSVQSNNTVAFLLNTGNLVLSSNDYPFGEGCYTPFDWKRYDWQSFDYPSDTYLFGMTSAVRTDDGENYAIITSWKSANDPSPGSFSIRIDSFGEQIVIWNQTRRMWRSGYWNGLIFTGVPNMTDSLLHGFRFAPTGEFQGVSLTYTPSEANELCRLRIGWDGKGEQWKWDDDLKSWNVLKSEPLNDSEFYNFCGNSGVYDVSKSPKCSCLPGFKPNNADEWNRGIWTNGCTRRTRLLYNTTNNGNEVGKEDGFLKLKMMKLPDYFHKKLANSEDECGSRCLKNCFCIAYAYDGFIGCMIWLNWPNENLTDIAKLSSSGNDLYIRLAYSEFDRKEKETLIIIITAIIIGTIYIFCTFLLRRHMDKRRARNENTEDMLLFDRGKTCTSKVELREVPLFKFVELTTSTNNFNTANLLGQGGFGLVYRGTLQNGQEIAVKRLSRASGQGVDEFKNEVLVISNLQHRNLVKLLGCCVEGEEKILIYEYMPNNSLDTYLFDLLKKELLDWRKRFNIIEGISQGLLYLHRHSRLRIIYRDLKASNILLDEKLQPKISDFGLARIFGDSEDQANTKRVVGTYGYMPPEYAMEGLFSEKSDVYSYGVLLLEIVSGRRNNSFYNDEHLSLVGYAWKLWNEGNILALVDNMVADPSHHEEVLTCTHVGLLCVQEFAKDRPNMSTVISMLNRAIVDLPCPKQPAFTLRQNNASDAESPAQHDQQRCSLNNVTLSTVEGR
ncbi:hypothetical protein SLE2022_014100 [Rubroshorea leprosula]